MRCARSVSTVAGTLTLAASLAAGASGDEGSRRLTAAEIAGRVRAYAAPLAEKGQLSGTLLVARDGKVILQESHGMASHELGVPNTPSTRFCIASITKPITIAVVSQLAEEEKLSAQDKVSRWIDGFPRGDEITVSHLLNHQAGIPHRVTTAAQESRYLSAAEMVEIVKEAELEFEPGKRSTYSSAGYTVLARIIEIVEGKPYGEVIRERIFVPAGMTSSGHPERRRIMPGRAPNYVPGPGGVLRSRLVDMSHLVGAGSVFSTPGDLLALSRALMEGRLGEAARRALVREDGLHWNGIASGYRAFLEHDALTGITVVFAGNMHTGATEFLRDSLPRLAAGEEVPPPPDIQVGRAEVAPAVLRGYLGAYRSQRGQEIEIRLDDLGVWADDWVLVPTSGTSFFSPQDYGTIEMVLDESGRATGLDWNWKGKIMTRFTRISGGEDPAAP